MTQLGQGGVMFSKRIHDPTADQIVELNAVKLDHIPNCC